MQAVAAWFSEFWIYAVVFVLCCILAVFACSKAYKAYKKHKSRYNAQEAEIKRLISLKEKYFPLTCEAIESAEDAELLEGAALSLQIELEKSEDMMKTFLQYNEEKKNIYTLDVFTSDKTLKTFFSQNGQELKSLAVPALKMVGLTQEADLINKVSLMYDDSDETTSLNYAVIEQTQKKLDEKDFLTKIKHSAARYIKENPEKFIKQ